ncbi:hypothetical protein ACH4E7_35055 [Kitasatospora sp. NPDC018058]|uniref:hypothetical protein n=1 Tax=Kitasatospora sp. NPDC018058 TaxID=3364025 RepID=UPI0037C18567
MLSRRGRPGTDAGAASSVRRRHRRRPRGTVTRLRVVDPSFADRPALPVALAEAIGSDLPLTNKSFNLSRAGNDL